MWVILDTWSRYLKVHRVRDIAGAGEQGLLIGDVMDVAREFDTAVAVLHHNRKNPSAAAESGDGEGEYRDSTAIGAAVDMIVSVSRGTSPTARRLTPSGRWRQEPLTIVLEPGVGFALAPDLEEPEQPETTAPPRTLTDRVLLHLLRCDPQARPHARTLAVALDCAGRRYQDLRAALDDLLDAGHIDHDERPGAASWRERGYALTSEGRVRAETLREHQCYVLHVSPQGGGRKRKPETCTAMDRHGWHHTSAQGPVMATRKPERDWTAAGVNEPSHTTRNVHRSQVRLTSTVGRGITGRARRPGRPPNRPSAGDGARTGPTVRRPPRPCSAPRARGPPR